METTIWDNMKSCCDEMKSCSFQGEGNESKEKARTDMIKAMANCMGKMKEKMKEGKDQTMKRVKWFILLPGLILLSAFLFTFFFNPELVQIFWLVITGTLLTLGLVFMLMMARWFTKIKKGIKV